MSDKPEDKYIDDLFRDSIDNMETEPSDHFWNKAYDGILKKESTGYEKRLMIWRGVSLCLAAAVSGLIIYNVYTNRKVTNMEQQIAKIERNELQVANNQPRSVKNYAVQKFAVADNNQPGQSDINATQGHNEPVASPNTVKEQTPRMAANHVIGHHHSKKASSPKIAYSGVSTQQNREREKYDRSGYENIIYLDERTPAEITVPSHSRQDSALYALDVADSLYMVPIGPPAPVKQIRKPFPRVSVDAYGAPSIARQIMKDNNPNDDVSVSDVKGNEHQEAGYTFGINVGYDLSNRLTLQTGCNYRVNNYTISSTTIDVPTGEWSQGYSFVTSSGTIYMPYITGYTPVGYDTAAVANGHIIRSYINIPLKLKYVFANTSKLGIYATAGGAVNILAYDYATIHCQNSWGEEDVSVYNLEGANPVNLSYLLGFGAELKLGKGFAVYAEPSYMGAITPSINSKALTVYSGYFDLAGGVSYHF